jgi:hypothetical protein
VGISPADVEPQRVEWLRKGRIPLGKLTAIDGDPEIGKSAMVTDFIGRISAGRAMLDGSPVEAGGAGLLNAIETACWRATPISCAKRLTL